MEHLHGWKRRTAGAAALAVAVAAITAGPADAAPSAPRAVGPRASGTSEDRRASFRLDGRRLTVTLATRLAPRGFTGRPSARLVCGDKVADLLPETAFPAAIFAQSGTRRLRVAPGVRTIRATLDKDVAQHANWCGLNWRSRAGVRVLDAHMTLTRGTPPGCEPAGREEVLAETDRLLVTKTSTPEHPDGGNVGLRACAKPAGAWRPLGVDWFDRFGAGSTQVKAMQGSWLALRWTSWDKYRSDGPCVLRMVDVGRPDSEVVEVWAPQESNILDWRCVGQVALADGRIAWTARTDFFDAAQEHAPPDHLLARSRDGAVVTLGTGRARSLTDPAISPDGTTVTWLESGQSRSAPLP